MKECPIIGCGEECNTPPRRVPIEGDNDWEIARCDKRGVQTYARKNEYKVPPVKVLKVEFSDKKKK